MQSSSPRNRHQNFSLSNYPELGMVHIHPISDNLPPIQPSNGLKESHSGVSTTELPPIISARDQYYRPLLSRVQLTLFHLLTVFSLLGIGIAKVIQGWKEGSVAVTWVDWVGGTSFIAIWYCISLYKNRNPAVAAWFFHHDISLDLFYFSVSIPLIAIGCFLAVFIIRSSTLALILICSPSLKRIVDLGGWFYILLLPWSIMAILMLLAVCCLHVYIKTTLPRHFSNLVHDLLTPNLYGRRAIQQFHAFMEGAIARSREQRMIYYSVWIITVFIASGMAAIIVDEKFKSFAPTRS